MSSEKIQISLTRKELRTLVQMACIAEWVTCAGDDVVDEKFAEDVDTMSQRIYQIAVKHKLRRLAYYDKKRDRYESEPMVAIRESPVGRAIRAYEKECVRDELTRELFTDAAIREVGQDVWNEMDMESKFALMTYHEQRISEAFEKHGYGALIVTTADPAQ